jgi:hypothetical protein
VNPLLIFWYTPIVYTALTALGKIAYRWRKRRLGRRGPVSKIIFQIPTIGNVEETNTIIETVKSYNLPVPVEAWVIIDEQNYRPDMRFNCDRLVIVPKDFRTSCMYKSRSLEYARRLRTSEGHGDYIVVQADDDSTPSREFMLEALEVDADVMVGTITPRPIGHLVADYERPVACAMTCMSSTNLGFPIWGHGEGMVISARADRLISYEPPQGRPLISSEDLFYLHRAAYNSLAEDQYYVQEAKKRSLKVFASDKRVYITPPLSVRDAIRQRRRWLWGHIRLIRNRMLPLRSLALVAFAEFSGLSVYATATTLGILVPLGLVSLSWYEQLLAYVSLALWFGFRGYSIGKAMGWRQALRGALLSFVTVTLNFAYHVIGLIQGDPRRFEVIKKYVPKGSNMT